MRKRADTSLPSPDLRVDSHHYVAGLRPFRAKTYRLESTVLGKKLLVHNYGHGGAGISMSWGCAKEVLSMVQSAGVQKADQIAMLGAGVMGLTAATLLVEAEFNVTVYSKTFHPCTTSNVAGGQWAPSFVEHDSEGGQQQFDRILRNAFHMHERCIPKGFVAYRDNYTEEKSPSFSQVPHDVIPEPDKLDHLPFEKLKRSGYRYRTLLIEVPIFLQQTHCDLVARGTSFVYKDFQDAQQVAELPEQVVVNCTGLGSKSIWPDPDLVPLRGQLVILPPQPELKYLFSHTGYLFPRRDGVVIGGTREPNECNPVPNPVTCHNDIFLAMKRVFDGEFIDLTILPPWFIVNK